MSPSSPVSVGMTPSNRTLEVGSVQNSVISSNVRALEQRPRRDDPFTDASLVFKETTAGIARGTSGEREKIIAKKATNRRKETDHS